MRTLRKGCLLGAGVATEAAVPRNVPRWRERERNSLHLFRSAAFDQTLLEASQQGLSRDAGSRGHLPGAERAKQGPGGGWGGGGRGINGELAQAGRAW